MVRADGSTVPAVSVWKSVPYFASTSQSSEPRSPRMASQSEDRGESSDSARKRPPRKKPHITGIWPCKINGCNKQFAREADLKRHQRTTKMHSMPNFQCPQCDANFTRADALRRHQKSRHDGVVIMTPELGNDEDENGRSRSGTPSSSKGKERETNIPVQIHQGPPTHSGPSSYYRSHTVIMTPHIPVSQMSALPPTSSPPWITYPSSWQNGTLPPNMGPIGYLPHNMYYPSPHYRPHTNEYPATEPSSYLKPPAPTATDASSSTQPPSSRNSSAQPPNQVTQQTTSTTINAPSIDPNLDDGSELTEAEVLAAVQAVLMQAEAKDQREREEKEREQREQQQQQGGMELQDSPRHDDDDGDLSDRNDMDSMDLDDVVDGLQAYGSSSLNRPEPMEHMLTEDGEPMLNPAELLTQESLASPPPS